MIIKRRHVGRPIACWRVTDWWHTATSRAWSKANRLLAINHANVTKIMLWYCPIASLTLIRLSTSLSWICLVVLPYIRELVYTYIRSCVCISIWWPSGPCSTADGIAGGRSYRPALLALRVAGGRSYRPALLALINRQSIFMLTQIINDQMHRIV
jgi:hypothetical protein